MVRYIPENQQIDINYQERCISQYEVQISVSSYINVDVHIMPISHCGYIHIVPPYIIVDSTWWEEYIDDGHLILPLQH